MRELTKGCLLCGGSHIPQVCKRFLLMQRTSVILASHVSSLRRNSLGASCPSWPPDEWRLHFGVFTDEHTTDNYDAHFYRS